MIHYRSKDQDDIEIMRSVADMADRPLLAGGPPSLIQMRVAFRRIREARQVIQVSVSPREARGKSGLTTSLEDVTSQHYYVENTKRNDKGLQPFHNR
jgi:hypothetical protein